ncbi:hypothetical protein [Acidocella sp.]|uniref:hypothetical protein n=1 Tax=Acidocella sp. TaxID=50710 RepID=UPI002F3F0355
MFKLEFETDNPAFEAQGAYEIGTVLTNVRAAIVRRIYGADGNLIAGSGTIRDSNGRTIGAREYRP